MDITSLNWPVLRSYIRLVGLSLGFTTTLLRMSGFLFLLGNNFLFRFTSHDLGTLTKHGCSFPYTCDVGRNTSGGVCCVPQSRTTGSFSRVRIRLWPHAFGRRWCSPRPSSTGLQRPIWSASVYVVKIASTQEMQNHKYAWEKIASTHT